MHIDVLCIVGASGLLYCSPRAWCRLSSPRFSPRCRRTAPSVKPNVSDAANAQLILRSEIAKTVLGTCIPTCPATIPLRARTSASSWVKQRYRWDPKMTGFWRFLSGFSKNRKNELSGTQSPLKVSFPVFLVERAPSLVSSYRYRAQRKRKNPCHLPALAAVIVDCISGGLCLSSVTLSWVQAYWRVSYKCMFAHGGTLSDSSEPKQQLTGTAPCRRTAGRLAERCTLPKAEG